MELVGVRNITIDASENSQITFDVQEGRIFKVMSFTHSIPPMTYSPWLKLNNEYIYFAH